MSGSAKSKFQMMSLKKRYRFVRDEGIYLTSRSFGSFEVHLYSVDDLYVEMWLRVVFHELAWIEAVTVEQVKERYPKLKGTG